MPQKTILFLGCGYVGERLGYHLYKEGWKVYATTRTPYSHSHLKELGFTPVLFSAVSSLENISHVLSSIPPEEEGDAGLLFLKRQQHTPSWIGYLSSTSVYGDHQGHWVNENSETRAQSPEGLRRLKSEVAWKDFAEQQGSSLLIYRLAGIYGPYRNIFQRMKEGKEFPKEVSHHLFSRIHVDDICTFLLKSLSLSSKFSIFNGADDLPASFESVQSYAYSLMQEENFLKIKSDKEEDVVHPSFLKEKRRVSNLKMKKFLERDLKFPTFREGLKDIYQKRLF
ncbi:MAG: NAD-dependent epimerase/dehydratase family protein [Proteobacteria bacterium]|nr:NAD-dependent epimerase/dehydratase family protein [Pseudomonadota bacterium]